MASVEGVYRAGSSFFRNPGKYNRRYTQTIVARVRTRTMGTFARLSTDDTHLCSDLTRLREAVAVVNSETPSSLHHASFGLI